MTALRLLACRMLGHKIQRKAGYEYLWREPWGIGPAATISARCRRCGATDSPAPFLRAAPGQQPTATD